MSAISSVRMDFTVERFIKLNGEDLKMQIALLLFNQDGWDNFAEDLLDEKNWFNDIPVDDGLTSMKELIDLLDKEPHEVLAKYITPDLEGSTFEGEVSKDGAYISVRLSFDFDWLAYRKARAERNVA